MIGKPQSEAQRSGMTQDGFSNDGEHGYLAIPIR
jgi:hypothetical protein